MINEPNLLDQNIIKTILSEVENGEHVERKREAWKAYQVYSGNIKPYVEAELRSKRTQSWQDYTVSTIGVSRMVVDKLSKSYDSQPKREIGNDANDIKSARLNEIFDQACADRQLKEFDEIVNLHRFGLFWVNYNEALEGYQFMSLAPYEFFVIRDKDTGKLITVGLKYPDSEITAGSNSAGSAISGDGHSDLIAEGQADGTGESDVYALWNSTQHVVIRYTKEEVTEVDGRTSFKKDVTYVEIPDNPNNENKIGRIPFVWVSKDNSVDLPVVNPITEQTITFNYLYSELLTAANVQGTSIQTLSYSESMVGKMDTITHGLTSAAELIQPDDPTLPRTEMDFISPKPDLSAQKDVYKEYLEAVLSTHGITGAQTLGSGQAFSSGIERLIASADTQGLISNMQQTLYTPMEREIFEILKSWEAFLGKGTFKDDDELTVVYEKPKVLITDKEALENIKMRLDLGLIEKWEALVMLDPNLDEDKAKEKLERIDGEKTKNVRGILGGLQQEQGEQKDPIKP